MGVYVNPQGEPKELWLIREGVFYDPNNGFYRTENEMIVCLIDNGPFTAAGVAYSKSEFEAFNDSTDPRPKTWFKVPINKLLEVSDVDRVLDR